MKVQGTVHKFGSNVDTDVIIPARYLNTSSPEELALREHAPIAIKASGVSLVIANTFARIFYRNSINIGLPILECPEAVKAIREGDNVSCDLALGIIRNETTGEEFKAQPFPPFIQRIIDAGGLINSLKQ